MTLQSELDHRILAELRQMGISTRAKPKIIETEQGPGEWYWCGEYPVEEYCSDSTEAIASLKIRGIAHVRRFCNRPERDQATAWFNQYVSDTGDVIDSEIC